MVKINHNENNKLQEEQTRGWIKKRKDKKRLFYLRHILYAPVFSVVSLCKFLALLNVYEQALRIKTLRDFVEFSLN